MPFVFNFFDKSEFSFNSSSDGLDILYGGNVFGHNTLKHDLLLLDLNDCYNSSSSVFVSHFDSNFELIKWHARFGHIGQDR